MGKLLGTLLGLLLVAIVLKTVGFSWEGVRVVAAAAAAFPIEAYLAALLIWLVLYSDIGDSLSRLADAVEGLRLSLSRGDLRRIAALEGADDEVVTLRHDEDGTLQVIPAGRGV